MPSTDQNQKAAAILNPRAAGGRTAKLWPRISAALEQRLGTVRPLFTERPDHATELTRQALEAGCDLIISVGGDGTANEVANGFLQDDEPINSHARLGFIPIGTGSDLQRTLGASSDVDEAVETIASGVSRPIDVGKADFLSHDGKPLTRYFVNLLSFGMGGDVSVRAKKNVFSRLSGKLAFLYATVAVFLTYRGKRVRVVLDGTPLPSDLLIANIAIGNGCYHGGGMQPCPRAVMDDGLLEVTTIRHLGMYEFIRDLPVLYSDDVYQHPKVDHFRATGIRAESGEITRIEIDGEGLGRLPLDVTILPRILPVLVPAGSTLAKRPHHGEPFAG